MRQTQGMRTVLITWRPFMARILLEWVASRGDELVLLETTQGRPTIRGDMWKSVLDQLPFEVPGVVARHTVEVAPLVESLEPDLVVSFSYPHLIDARTVAAARVAALNVHPGRLPTYRGPNPMWAIYRGESEIDISVHRLATEYDTGEVLAVTTVPLDAAPTPEHVFGLWESAAGPTLDAAVDRVLSGEGGWAQPEGDVDVLPLFTAAEGELDWDVATRTLMCRWTACAMGGTLVTVPIDGVRRTVRGLRVVVDAATSDKPGTVLSSLGSDHIVAASDGLMLVEVD